MQIGERLTAGSAREWREWLAANHAGRQDIWLVLYKKGSRRTGVCFQEAVEEALCFGWVDSQSRTIDGESYALRFTPRRPRSNWSATNRELALQLVREGRMTDAGLSVVPEDLRDRLENGAG